MSSGCGGVELGGWWGIRTITWISLCRSYSSIQSARKEINPVGLKTSPDTDNSPSHDINPLNHHTTNHSQRQPTEVLSTSLGSTPNQPQPHSPPNYPRQRHRTPIYINHPYQPTISSSPIRGLHPIQPTLRPHLQYPPNVFKRTRTTELEPILLGSRARTRTGDWVAPMG